MEPTTDQVDKNPPPPPPADPPKEIKADDAPAPTRAGEFQPPSINVNLSQIRQLPPHPEGAHYKRLFALKPFKYTQPDGKIIICPEAAVANVLDTKREGETKTEAEIILDKRYETTYQFEGERSAQDPACQSRKGPVARLATEEETSRTPHVPPKSEPASVLG